MGTFSIGYGDTMVKMCIFSLIRDSFHSASGYKNALIYAKILYIELALLCIS